MAGDPERDWRHPWLRIERLIRTIGGSRWDHRTWPRVKRVLKIALAARRRLRGAGWFN
jgi:hypothetical protein